MSSTNSTSTNVKGKFEDKTPPKPSKWISSSNGLYIGEVKKIQSSTSKHEYFQTLLNCESMGPLVVIFQFIPIPHLLSNIFITCNSFKKVLCHLLMNKVIKPNANDFTELFGYPIPGEMGYVDDNTPRNCESYVMTALLELGVLNPDDTIEIMKKIRVRRKKRKSARSKFSHKALVFDRKLFETKSIKVSELCYRNVYYYPICHLMLKNRNISPKKIFVRWPEIQINSNVHVKKYNFYEQYQAIIFYIVKNLENIQLGMSILDYLSKFENKFDIFKFILKKDVLKKELVYAYMMRYFKSETFPVLKEMNKIFKVDVSHFFYWFVNNLSRKDFPADSLNFFLKGTKLGEVQSKGIIEKLWFHRRDWLLEYALNVDIDETRLLIYKPHFELYSACERDDLDAVKVILKDYSFIEKENFHAKICHFDMHRFSNEMVSLVAKKVNYITFQTYCELCKKGFSEGKNFKLCDLFEKKVFREVLKGYNKSKLLDMLIETRRDDKIKKVLSEFRIKSNYTRNSIIQQFGNKNYLNSSFVTSLLSGYNGEYTYSIIEYLYERDKALAFKCIKEQKKPFDNYFSTWSNIFGLVRKDKKITLCLLNKIWWRNADISYDLLKKRAEVISDLESYNVKEYFIECHGCKKNVDIMKSKEFEMHETDYNDEEESEEMENEYLLFCKEKCRKENLSFEEPEF